MHGRESSLRLMESMDIIKRWNNDEEILFPNMNVYMEDLNMKDRPIDIWRNKIKNLF